MAMNPWDMMKEGAYAKAVEIYTHQIKVQGSSNCRLDLCNRGMGYLNLGRYEDALADFCEAEQVDRTDPFFKKNNLCGDAYRIKIGVALWLLGREKEAEETWASLLKDHENGIIAYTDAAGGIEVPCLAWFAGTASANHSLVHSAEALLDQRFAAEEAINWPGSLAPYILGKTSEKELLNAAMSSKPLMHSHLCQAQFYVGARATAAGEVKKAIRMFLAVYRTNALLESEYYLAAREYSKLVSPRQQQPGTLWPSRTKWWRFWT